jgi:Tfp pilus assembly protein PilF
MAPESAEASLKLGLCLQRTRDVESARVALERAVTLGPPSSEAWFALGLIRQDQREHAAATKAYRRALDVRPDSFGRIAQALAAAPVGEIWLDVAELRRSLAG